MGKATRIFPRLCGNFGRRLAEVQRGLAYDTLRLPPKALGELASILVDFAEDLHNGIGTWEAYERYNVEFFGTPCSLDFGSKSRRNWLPSRSLPPSPLDLVSGVH